MMTEGKGVEQIIDEEQTGLFTTIKVSGIGSRLIFQYVVGMAVLLCLTNLFESLPWVYDPIMRSIIKAADYLPILVIMWAVLSAGQIASEITLRAFNWFRKLNKIVNKEETEK